MHKTLELVGYKRTFGNKQVYWRDCEEGRDAELLVVLEKFRKVELGHPIHGPTGHDRVDEIALATSDMGGRKVSDGPIFEWRPSRIMRCFALASTRCTCIGGSKLGQLCSCGK
jgi:hypothetical protein